MKRRQLLAGGGSLLLSTTLLGTAPLSAAKIEHESYSRDSYEQALADGKPFMLDFYASW